MLKKYLITPGPVSVPEQVLLDMARPMIHHRTPEFEEIFKEARNGLKKVFKTEQEPLILASSGTGAMESAVINTLSPWLGPPSPDRVCPSSTTISASPGPWSRGPRNTPPPARRTGRSGLPGNPSSGILSDTAPPGPGPGGPRPPGFPGPP